MSAPSMPDSQPAPDSSWEGDRMFNIYIYDYCNKRGFRNTARELLQEADIPPDSAPPINAKQGLLFEWWSVFWVLFTAKSSGTGTEDAMVYTQHQLQQTSLRQGPRPLGHQVARMINGNPPQIPFSIAQNGIPPSAPAGPNTPQNFTALMPNHPQRPGPPQHRGPNGINPYHSPTMASQNPGPNPQNIGPSPHMPHMARGGMLPPNASMAAQTPPFSQLARPSSRPGSPGQMMQRSPSLMGRQTPNTPESSLNAELSRLPTNILTSIRQELGLHDKELQSLTFDEKSRIVNLARQRAAGAAVRKSGPGGPQGPAGPSSLMQLPAQRPSGQPQPPQQQSAPQQPQPPQQQSRVVKRNSTSPGEEHGQLPNSESSPPDRKRVRRSSVNIDQPPYPHPPQQQAPQHMMNGALMRPGMPPMNNFSSHGPAMGNPAMGIPLGPQMPGSAMGGPRAPNMMGQLHYHQVVHAATKGLAMANLPGGGAGTPAPGDSPFNPGPGQPFSGPQNTRLGPNKMGMGMPPPPSSAGGPSKEQPKDGKPPVQNGAEGSPRNQHPPNPATAPNTGGGAQGNTAPPTPSGTSSSMTAPSPSAAVGGTPTINAATQPTTSLPEMPASFLTTEFMQSVANTLEDFDPQGLFRPEDTGINFEQDFREWFNPDDLEMK